MGTWDFIFEIRTMKTVICSFTVFILLSTTQALEIMSKLNSPKDVLQLENAIDTAIEAFQLYDTSPKDEKLTYSEIEKVPRLAVTPEIFARTFDLNKDGHLTVAEMAAAVFAERY